MAGLDFSNVDWQTVARDACGPGTHWNGQKCVPDAVEQAASDLSGIDFAGLAAQYPDIFGGPGPTVAAEISPYNEDSTKRGQYSEGFSAADATSGLTTPAAPAAPAALAPTGYAGGYHAGGYHAGSAGWRRLRRPSPSADSNRRHCRHPPAAW